MFPPGRGPGDSGNAELDARLAGTWQAGTAAVGQLLDIPAGKEALLAGPALVQDLTARRPGLAAGPGRRAWQRRRRLGFGLAGGVAAVLAVVVAVALAATGAPGSRPDGGAIKTVDLVRRVDRALTAAEPGQLAQMTVTSSGAAGTLVSKEWSYGNRWRLVTDWPGGRPDYAEGFRSPATFTLVSYRARAWARHQVRAVPARTLGPRGCGQPAAAFPLLFQPWLQAAGMAASSRPATVARDLRAAISCGALVVAGRQRTGGVNAIKLTSRPGSPISETIWVSPGSYLPVRVTARSATGNHILSQTATISWLPLTAQSLAKLAVPVPAGFRRVPLWLLLRRTSAGLAQKVRAAS